ncbi:hypothetical protein GJAV_G00212130 [Gymnothorax javanicus]|nr:hypothetical protein GJAV_G00212130 [Gymnothorax javanicus]
MHRPEPAGESAGPRKMAHPAIFTRSGSNTGVGSVSALATGAGTSMSSNLVSTDDHQSPAVMHPTPPAGSASPGPQQPPHSLNLLSQAQIPSQTLTSAGAQIKKKSGFQITSVTPAQISVSANNSIAEDTESYDDLDESHTEDLSSSEILDVSLSRTTDIGGPERSSSEETLSNIHDAESPGTPNQPPHHIAQPPVHSVMLNGNMHHHHHHHHHNHHHHHHHGHHLGHHQSPTPHSGAGVVPLSASGLPVEGTSVTAAVPCTSGGAGTVSLSTQACAVAPVGQVSTATPVASVSAVTPIAKVSMSTITPTVQLGSRGTVTPIAQVSSVASITQAGASAFTPVAQISVSTFTPVAHAGVSTATPVAQEHSVSSLAPSATGGSVLSPGLGRTSSHSSGGLSPGLVNLGISTDLLGSSSQNVTLNQQQSGTVSTSGSGAVGLQGGIQVMAPGPQGPTQAPAPGSRFRVVKLDSGLESYRKGRWTCTEYYDKESTPVTPPTTQAPPAHQALSCQWESEGSVGETGGPPIQDYTQISGPGPPQGTIQTQEAQDALTLLHKASTGPQLAGYTQAATLQAAPVAYPPGQEPASGLPASANPPLPLPVSQTSDFMHHQPISQPAVSETSHLLPPVSAVAPPVAASGNCVLPASALHVSPVAPIALAPQSVVPPQALPNNVPDLGQPLPETRPPPAPLVSGPITYTAPSHSGLTQPHPGRALYSSVPPYTATQLKDAQRLLFQHPGLFSLPRLASAGKASETGVTLASQDGGSANRANANAIPASAGLFPLSSLPVDGEDDR